MNTQNQRIAIAEACGWKLNPFDYHGVPMWETLNPQGERVFSTVSEGAWALGALPDYLNDLNAMHEAEKACLTDSGLACSYSDELRRTTYNHIWHATAAQRAEALLRTIGKWEDAP